MITVGTFEFKSIEAVKRHVRTHLASLGDGPTTDPFLFALFTRHPCLSLVPDSFVIRGTDLTFVSGGEETLFGWIKCCRGKDDPKTDAIQCMRRAIHPDIEAYRQNQSATSCAACNAHGVLQVDHCELPFSVIQADFIGLEPAPTIYRKNGMKGKVFDDDEYTSRWIDYHRLKATYQMLCQPCNGKKSNKIENGLDGKC